MSSEGEPQTLLDRLFTRLSTVILGLSVLLFALVVVMNGWEAAARFFFWLRPFTRSRSPWCWHLWSILLVMPIFCTKMKTSGWRTSSGNLRRASRG